MDTWVHKDLLVTALMTNYLTLLAGNWFTNILIKFIAKPEILIVLSL